ncbi:nickel-dependent hydrogenase large subunit [Shigella flexneri]
MFLRQADDRPEKRRDLATASTEKWEPATWPTECRGVGFTEAPRGALGHSAAIRDGKIDLTSAWCKTTWNASPRDPKGQIGAYEAALMKRQNGNPRATAGDPAYSAQL